MIGRLSIDSVREAAQRIEPFVVRTPVLPVALSETCELLLKAESLQPTGSFKLRGAFNKMLRLPEDCAGVVAHFGTSSPSPMVPVQDDR